MSTRPKRHRYRPSLSEKLLGLTAVTLMLLASSDVTASSAAPKLSDLGDPVSDAELGEIRGKFITPEAVSFFGIEMVTSWQDAAGITTTAQLVFTVDFLKDQNGQPVPGLMIGWSRDGDPAMDITDTNEGYVPVIAAQQVLPIGGLDSTRGATQANLIAGTQNTARNSMQIALVPASQVSRFATGGLNPVTVGQTVTFGDGDTLEFRASDNTLGLALTGANGGDSTLQIAGGQFGSLLQQTLLNSDRNDVMNSTAVVIGADMGSGFDAVRASEALSVMHGHGF